MDKGLIDRREAEAAKREQEDQEIEYRFHTLG